MEISAAIFRYYAGFTDKVTGSVIPSNNGNLVYQKHHPIGVCGQIIPWNFPFWELIQKVAPILASGCTSIVKVSEMTPLSAFWLGQVLKDSGMPAGVINIITGYGHEAGEELVLHPVVAKIGFTGSNPIGKRV